MTVELDPFLGLARDKLREVEEAILSAQRELDRLLYIRRGLRALLGEDRTPNMQGADDRQGLTPTQVKIVEVLDQMGIDPLRPLPRGAADIILDKAGVASRATLQRHLRNIKTWARARRQP